MRIVSLVKRSSTLIIALSLGATIGCKKDDDEEESPAVVIGPNSGGSIATPGSLMLAIDTTCGGEPCIKTNTALHLEESDESFVQTIRGFYWLTTGFPDVASHASFVPAEAHTLIPQAGLTGRIENVRAHVVETLIANSSGLTKCTDVPTSGSFEVEDDGTYTLAEAKNSAPATYPKAGLYDRRLEYVGNSDFDAVFEWFCDYAGMMVKFSPKNAAGESLGFDYAFYYDREDASDGHFEFFLNDEGKGAMQSEPMSLALKVNVMSETFRTWMTQYAMHSGEIAGYRAIGHTNIESQETSLWYQDLHNTPMSTSAWSNSTDAKASTITTAVAPNTGNSEDARQGCAENFSIQASTITSSTLCSGLTLEVAAAPAIDSDGNWSMSWIHANLATKLSAL